MWIFLTQKLPTEVAPPAMSIHWAGASATDVERARKQQARSSQRLSTSRMDFAAWAQQPLVDLGDKYFDGARGYGYEPKEEGAVWIIFDNVPIKVWLHEYTVVKPENLHLYLMGEGSDEYSMSHFPMFGSVPLFADPWTLKVSRRFAEYSAYNPELADAARVDGQNDLQAFYTAVGGFPLDLWYAIGEHYPHGRREYEMTPVYRKLDPVLDNLRSRWKEESA